MNRARRDAHWAAKMRIAELTPAAREAAIRLLAQDGGEPEAVALTYHSWPLTSSPQPRATGADTGSPA